MLLDKRVDMSHALVLEDFIHGNKDARFLYISKSVVDGSAEELHRGAQSHIGIDKRRDVVSEIAYLAIENLVVLLERLLAEERLQLLRVGLYLKRVHGQDKIILVLEMFFQEIQDHVASLAYVRGIHGHLAKEILYVGLDDGECSKTVPQIIEGEERL